MSAREIEFIFDLSSPAAYLAHSQLPAIASRTKASILYVPVLLGGLYKVTGNPSPLAVPAKFAYHLLDMERWATRHGVPLRWPAPFPIHAALPLMRGAIVARRYQRLEAFVSAAFTAIFVDGSGLSEHDQLAAIAERAGIGSSQFLNDVEDQEIKDELRLGTEAAAARGVFGVPTFFVDDAMFFGQDRLDFVIEAVNAC